MVAKGIFLLSIYKCTHIKARTMIADKTPSNASRFSSVVSSPSSIPKMYDPNTLSSVFNCFNLFVNHLLNASLADDIFNTHAHVEWWTKKMKFNQSKRLTRWCVSNRSTQCINWITPNDFSRFLFYFQVSSIYEEILSTDEKTYCSNLSMVYSFDTWASMYAWQLVLFCRSSAMRWTAFESSQRNKTLQKKRGTCLNN